jgi:hypothetical protein
MIPTYHTYLKEALAKNSNVYLPPAPYGLALATAMLKHLVDTTRPGQRFWVGRTEDDRIHVTLNIEEVPNVVLNAADLTSRMLWGYIHQLKTGESVFVNGATTASSLIKNATHRHWKRNETKPMFKTKTELDGVRITRM